MLEFRSEVDTHLLRQKRANCAGFDEVDYSNNLQHHCRMTQRQMLRSNILLRLTCFTCEVNRRRAPSIAGVSSVHKLTVFPINAFFLLKVIHNVEDDDTHCNFGAPSSPHTSLALNLAAIWLVTSVAALLFKLS